MGNATDGVRDLVADVLRSLPQPYSEDVTDEVCRAIEADPGFRRRYNELASELKDWVVNNGNRPVNGRVDRPPEQGAGFGEERPGPVV